MRHLSKVTMFLTIACWSQAAVSEIYIHAGKLIHPKSSKIQNDVTIITIDDEIISIKPGFLKPRSNEATVIDLKKKTVLPGLMDMHTHISFEYGPRAQVERFTVNDAEFTIRGLENAKKTLLAGFTTIRDLGDGNNTTIAVRDAINANRFPGPRIFTAGKSIATTGGHADPTNGRRWDTMFDVGPKGGVINGVAQARQSVRQRYKEGSDLIKITATGGVLSVAKSGRNPQFMKDELEAIVQTAKDYGFTVAVHAHGKEGMKRAIKAGVSSIEHGTYMDREIFALMKKHKVYYVPTILAGNWVAEKSKISGFFPEIVRPKAAEIGPLILSTFSKAHKAGVPIAYGTDSGVSAHGDNAQEFALMVKGGMEPMAAINSATYHGAKLLGMEDSLGQIKPGFKADIIAVDGDPLKNIRELESVSFVMSRGVVVKNLSTMIQNQASIH
ncbi:MAG: amidohydrolase family protein [Pseudobacteriovorax sp.]|nr:amidohydrolase family protein [Pseudobacteriovorax sp.]